MNALAAEIFGEATGEVKPEPQEHLTELERDGEKIYGPDPTADQKGHTPVHTPDQGLLEEGRKLVAVMSLHFVNYNYARPHKMLTKARNGYPPTPAMAAGLTDHAWTVQEIVGLLEFKLGPLPPLEVRPQPTRIRPTDPLREGDDPTEERLTASIPIAQATAAAS